MLVEKSKSVSLCFEFEFLFKQRLVLHCTEYYARCDWSLRFMCKIIDSSLEEKVDLHKFALDNCVAKL